MSETPQAAEAPDSLVAERAESQATLPLQRLRVRRWLLGLELGLYCVAMVAAYRAQPAFWQLLIALLLWSAWGSTAGVELWKAWGPQKSPTASKTPDPGSTF